MPRKYVILSVVQFLIVLLALVFAFVQQTIAKEKEREAVAAMVEADHQRQAAEAARAEAEKQRMAAVAAREEAKRQQKISEVGRTKAAR